ncbi:MAG: hypothetical protein GVY35_07750 [Bacteroidetes bacterium]|jgi:hypothetical protein|nr:hypothetical protein [Bacteroidota bacterium]
MPRTPHLRIWIVASALLLIATGCGPDVTDAPPVPARTEQAMALLPADARFAGMLDLQDLQANGGISFSSERGITVRFLDSDLTFNPLSAEYQERLQAFIEATGFEPGRDLHAAYVAGDTTRPRSVLLAADVDRTRLVDQLTKSFASRLDTTSYRGVPMMQLQAEGDDIPLQFALLNDGWIALSPDAQALRATVDRSLNAASEPTGDAMAPLVEAIGGRGGAWLTLRDLPTQRLMQSADDQRLSQLAGAVRDVASALRFTPDGVAGTALLTTDRDAGDIADVVRGAVSTVKMNQQLTEEQRQLLDQITVTDATGQVWIEFSLSQETLARLLIQSMQSRGEGGFLVAR